MKTPKFVSRLKAIYASAVLGGLALFSSGNALAQLAPEPSSSGEGPAPVSQVERIPERSVTPVASERSRGLDDQIDDFFARKPTVKVTKESFWIGPQERYDVRLLPVPENGLLRITREYLEIKPLRKEWYGRATGVSYSVQAEVGDGYTIGGSQWNLRTGLSLGSYQSPENRVENNSQYGTFIEGYRDTTIVGQKAHMILGTSFNRVSGNEIGNASDARVYTQLDFPAIFSKASSESGLGQFSGTLKGYAGTHTSGAQLGIYFNDLKSDGKGVNFSAGPEIRYDQRDGVSYRFKIRVAPKFW